ncbi:hypothetical protein [Chryseobacterium indologenes]|uniref:Uncharacterized protein n=1 Tax=Chryseobacterium indologenes TaxID=253 RepID=A0A0N1KSC6_CHRID|nr:hypothetical protein [Chryseobacterium indologenes]KPE50127.1 hypothetical protein AOB46_16950 [Chryseobacterium indologenes]
MKALKHLVNRFNYAWNGSKRLFLEKRDIDALNILIQEENSKKRNTQLEDSLILFYLLAAYKVQNKNNKAILEKRKPEEVRFPLGMPEASTILNRLSNILDPKQQIIQMIADELWIYQEYERIPKDRDLYLKELQEGINTWGKSIVLTDQEMIPIKKEDRITFEQVEELLNKALEYAKDNFPMFNALDKDFLKFIETKPLNSENPERWKDK